MERLWFIASRAEILEAREDFSLIRILAPAGDQPPLHVHEHDDEGFYVLAGSMTLWVGDAPPVTLVPGEFALAPHGVPHTFRVGDTGGEFLITSTAGAFAAFVAEAGEPAEAPGLPTLHGPPDVDRLTRIASSHGITFLAPPGTLPLAA